MKQGIFTQLLDRYVDGTASDQEKALVESYLDELEKGPVKQRSQKEDEAIQLRILKRIESRIQGRQGLLVSMSRVWRVAVAAAVVVIAVSVWFLVSDRSTKPGQADQAVVVKDVKAPESTRAVITLADGSKVYLDSAGNGILAQQNNVNLVRNEDGAISYQLTANSQQPMQYNTLSNPRGSKVIDMQLSDGSHVWLNSGSSITYPVAFVGSERKITVDGEAYFEVAHNASKPFIVTKGETSVQVLGTHFNVNAYSDESDIKITLLEGSVRVSRLTSGVSRPTSGVSRLPSDVSPLPSDVSRLPSDVSRLLVPGQQARVSDDIKLATDVDLEQVMAWKNGLFKFDKTDIQTVMRQISRWYDVEVSYPNGIPKDQYWGAIRRDQNLSTVFKVLEASGAHFKIEGKKVIVMP